MEEWERPWEAQNPALVYITSSPRQGPTEPPELLEADGDPEYSDKPIRKTKYVYRKKAQQRYRERVKIEKAEMEAAFEQSRKELETLTSNNRYLQDSQDALELLKTESDRLLDALMKAQKSLPVNDPYRVAESLVATLYSGQGVISDDQVRQYFSLPAAVSLKTDLHFMERLELLMAEWVVCYSSREKIELRLKNALQSRIKLSVLYPLLNPDGYLLIVKHRAAPPPGSAAGNAAKKQLMFILRDLELDEKQKEVIIEAMKEYRERVACLRAEMAMAQLALCTGANGVIGDEEASRKAETLIEVSERASVVNSMPLKMMHAYGRLAAAVLEPFSVIQYAKLLLGCMPHLPDYVVVGEIFSAGEV